MLGCRAVDARIEYRFLYCMQSPPVLYCPRFEFRVRWTDELEIPIAVFAPNEAGSQPDSGPGRTDVRAGVPDRDPDTTIGSLVRSGGVEYPAVM